MKVLQDLQRVNYHPLNASNDQEMKMVQKRVESMCWLLCALMTHAYRSFCNDFFCIALSAVVHNQLVHCQLVHNKLQLSKHLHCKPMHWGLCIAALCISPQPLMVDEQDTSQLTSMAKRTMHLRC